MVGGKAKLIRDVYCDGLGNCIPECKADAISFEEREAVSYDENAGRLNRWPIQLKLVAAAGFNDAELLVCASCTAFSYGNFHNVFMKGKVPVIGCPKLDGVDYSIKIGDILKNNSVKSITVVRMEVPCCGGIIFAVENALKNCGKDIIIRIVIISVDGNIISDTGEKS
jgi:ferredoxin